MELIRLLDARCVVEARQLGAPVNEILAPRPRESVRTVAPEGTSRVGARGAVEARDGVARTDAALAVGAGKTRSAQAPEGIDVIYTSSPE